MKSRPFLAFVLGLLVVLVVAGCSTFDSRARERASTFSQLDQPTRDRLKQREIAVGDTFDMVYIALGTPDQRRETTTAAGAETTWVFNRYWQEYQGDRFVGYQRFVVYNPRTRSYAVFYEPVHASIYVDRKEERLRVYFRDGQVSAVEQAS